MTTSWTLCFQVRPEGFKDMPDGIGLGTKESALQIHLEKCFEQLEEMIEDGARIVDRGYSVVSIEGDRSVCERLKERVETQGLAHMFENSAGSPFRPAR